MTDAAGTYWSTSTEAYKQPHVLNPPSMQNANNARHAVWHFARTLNLLVFTSGNHKWRAANSDAIDDGRHERGEPIVVSIKGVWQPNTQKRGRGVIDAVEGSRSESGFVIHLDSHQPENIAAAAAFPAIFPNGLRLVDFDDLGTDGLYNFPMAIEYRGNKYKIKQPIPLYGAGDEELNVEGAVYRAECQLWHDRHSELDARDNAPSWGPNL